MNFEFLIKYARSNCVFCHFNHYGQEECYEFRALIVIFLFISELRYSNKQYSVLVGIYLDSKFLGEVQKF